MTAAGHRGVPRAAEVRIEAWAPSREECVAEAVRAMAETVAGLPAAGPREAVELRVDAATDEDLLVAVLDEVIYQMDDTGRVPAAAHVTAAGDGLSVRLELVEPAAVVGATPTGVSLRGLRFASTGNEWRCAVTLDV